MNLKAAIKQTAAVTALAALCSCSSRKDLAIATIEQSLGEWLTNVDLAATNIQISGLDIELGNRDRCDFSCRVHGLRQERPTIAPVDFLQEVRFSELKGSSMTLKARDWLQLEWQIHLTQHRPVLKLGTNHVGYYINFKSDPASVAILFNDSYALVCANNWSTRPNPNPNKAKAATRVPPANGNQLQTPAAAK